MLQTSYYYQLYGLRLQSNRPISNLIETEATPAPIDLTVSFYDIEKRIAPPTNALQVYASAGHAPNGEPYLQIWKQVDESTDYLILQYTEGENFVTYIINKTATSVAIYLTLGQEFSDVLTYFLGPVIGCIQRVRGVTCLHAGVVAIDGQAVAIIGAKGAGKSTLVAALAEQGCPVLSDDLAPLYVHKGIYHVHSGYPQIRLWPTSIEHYPTLSTKKLKRILSNGKKRFVTLSEDKTASNWRFQAIGMPLTSVYVLEKREGTQTQTIKLNQTDGFFSLTKNVYAEYLLEAPERTANFTLLGKLAAITPVLQVKRPDKLDALTELCQIIKRNSSYEN